MIMRLPKEGAMIQYLDRADIHFGLVLRVKKPDGVNVLWIPKQDYEIWVLDDQGKKSMINFLQIQDVVQELRSPG